MADKEVQELRKLVAELTRRVDVLQYQLKEEREAREVVAARVGVLELGLNALSRGPIMPVLAAAAAVAPSSPVEQQAPADKTEGKISKAADSEKLPDVSKLKVSEAPAVLSSEAPAKSAAPAAPSGTAQATPKEKTKPLPNSIVSDPALEDLYRRGYTALLGPTPNEPEAVTLLTQAATQGHPDAMAMLSILIDDNPVDWARKAVAGGSALGMVALAQFLADDDDPEKEEENARESRRLFQRAGLEMRKLQMSPQGQYYLGSLYENGLGFPVDYGEAFKAYKVAAEAGHALAQFSLGIMYADGRGVKKDEQKAVSWLRKAAEQGNDDGQFSLAVMYANGFGVEKDDLTAAMWYQKAAKQDHEEAQLALGICYLQGEGVRADKVEATKWLQKAANKGNEEAKELLTRLGGRGRRRREQS